MMRPLSSAKKARGGRAVSRQGDVMERFRRFLDRPEEKRDASGDRPEWIYRGILLRSDREVLKSSFDLALERWKRYGFEVGANRRRELELQLFRDFQRRFVLSGLENPPPKQDILTWFALMRHYMVPARLLDFSYSPYVALFMAIRQLLEDGGESRGCAVIAIRRNVFDRALQASPPGTPKKLQVDIDRIRANDTEAFKSLFILNRNLLQPIIYPVMPYDLNRRLALQQGLFLCPSHIGLSFQENFDRFFAGLRAAGKWEGEYYDVIQFDSDACAAGLKHAFDELHRMNIYDISLFPDMEGYARSLMTRMPLHYEIATGKEHGWPFYEKYLEKLNQL